MSESIEERKSALRKEMKQRLTALGAEWCKQSSLMLSKHLAALLSEYKTHMLLAWLNHFPGEPDLSDLIETEVKTGRQVFLPRVSGDLLDFHLATDQWREDLAPGYFGVREPSGTTPKLELSASNPRLILVPGLAFDNQGNRLGRGKGFYDRVLSSPVKGEQISIGVCWEAQIRVAVPTSSLDRPVTSICTEISYRECRC